MLRKTAGTTVQTVRQLVAPRATGEIHNPGLLRGPGAADHACDLEMGRRHTCVRFILHPMASPSLRISVSLNRNFVICWLEATTRPIDTRRPARRLCNRVDRPRRPASHTTRTTWPELDPTSWPGSSQCLQATVSMAVSLVPVSLFLQPSGSAANDEPIPSTPPKPLTTSLRTRRVALLSLLARAVGVLCGQHNHGR